MDIGEGKAGETLENGQSIFLNLSQ